MTCVILDDQYSFCKCATATAFTPLHIRERDKRELPNYGGDCDTPSLCGREVGWDQKLRQLPIQCICKRCLAAYRKHENPVNGGKAMSDAINKVKLAVLAWAEDRGYNRELDAIFAPLEAKLAKAECDNLWHDIGGLATPCPECGEGGEKR